VTRSRIGPLALESPLGDRGSHIYRALHMQQKAQVAVRVFSVPMGMTPEAKQEFAEQLESLKALRHPGIVQRARAEVLIARDDLGSHNDARDKYLYNLIERFPDGENSLWAKEQLDLIEMENAESRIQSNRRFGREPSSEGERKYSEASRYELFGDRVTALEQYQGIVNLLKDEEKERAYVNLARRQIAKIQSKPPSIEELRRFLREKLDQADKMYSSADAIGAKQIWESIVNLYNGNKEMLPIVEQAQAKLSKLRN